MAKKLVMPNIAGSIIMCFLDNTVPGNYCNTYEVFDRAMTMTMIRGMPNLAGSIIACFLNKQY